MDAIEVHKWLEWIERHLPFIGAVLTGITGMAATVYGYFGLQTLRLHRIERAIGKEVLSGEKKLATIEAMNECKTRILQSLEDHVTTEKDSFEQFKASQAHMHERIDRIYDHLVEKGR